MYVCPSIFFDRTFESERDILIAFEAYNGEKDTTNAPIYKEI